MQLLELRSWHQNPETGDSQQPWDLLFQVLSTCPFAVTTLEKSDLFSALPDVRLYCTRTCSHRVYPDHIALKK